MYRFCYSVFANELAKSARRTKRIMTPMANGFFGFALGDSGRANGFNYSLSSSLAKKWFIGTEQIPDDIQNYGQDVKFYKCIHDNVDDLINLHLYKEKLEPICAAIYEKAMAVPNVEPQKRKDIKAALEQKDWTTFLTDCFQVSLLQENDINAQREKNKVQSIQDEIKLIRFIQENCNKPIIIPVPKNPTVKEICYVSALLEAYSDDAQVSIVSEEQLSERPEYKDYKKDLDCERRYFYSAESLKEATRDGDLFKKDTLSFDGFKEELKAKTRATFSAQYKNGLERMFTVTNQAVIVELDSLLGKKLKWLTDSIKKGTIHMIVNDENASWVKYGDK